MKLTYLTHPELVNHLKDLLAVEHLSPADARTVRSLIDERSFSRAQKETISKLSTKYQHEQHDRYTIFLHANNKQENPAASNSR